MDHAAALYQNEQRSTGRRRSQGSVQGQSSGKQDGDRQGKSCGSQNVASGERIASALVGTALVLGGVSRGGLGGLLMGLGGGALIKRGASGQCQLYQAIGIDTSSSQGGDASIPAKHGVKVEKSFTVNRSPEELFDYWSNVENLPRIMQHLKSVEHTEGNRTRWVAEGPMNMSVQWEAETIVQSRPHVISWRSLPGSQVDTAGSVHFTAQGNDRGTMVKVSLKYDPPGGKVGAAIAWLFGQDAEQQLDDDLRRFKAVMEAGEAPTVKGQPQGR